MKLPNAHKAVVERQKVTRYLLNPAHPDNGGKAGFFTGLGFTPEDWEIFAEALCRLAMNASAARCIESAHGQKYVQDGQLQTPCGKMAGVRAIWIIDDGSDAPRLVTTYPCEMSEA